MLISVYSQRYTYQIPPLHPLGFVPTSVPCVSCIDSIVHCRYPVAISCDRFLVNLARNVKYYELYDSVSALLHLTCAVYLCQGFSVQVFSDLSCSCFLFVNV